MISMLVALVGVGCILLVSEAAWYVLRLKRSETTRKLVHIATGVYVAFWPLFLSFAQIQLLSLVLCTVVFASKKFHVFRSIHSVRRKTYGEILFPLGIFVAATFASSGWIYMAAVLHLSVADGLAGLIGTRYLKRSKYVIAGNTKTIVGTAVFFAVSLGILASIMLADPAAYGNHVMLVLAVLPMVTTLLENISPYGTDNLSVPMVVVLILNMMRGVA